jgi:voltage-gated potassium channel
MKKASQTELRPCLFLALGLSTPAFYLMLTGLSAPSRDYGSWLYVLSALLIALDVFLQTRHQQQTRTHWRQFFFSDFPLELILICGALLSAWPSTPPWPLLEWALRLGFCCLVVITLLKQITIWVGPNHLVQILTISLGLLAVAGGGFYWLEPKVITYGDGLWLAFITGATVGYGDLVPSTPASRIFAIFIVLLGYAVFSVVTASIAALFVGEDEKRFEKELHADILVLRDEIATLRIEMQRALKDREA